MTTGTRSDWPRVGIFAQRAKDRPNRIDVGVARLLGVEGRELRQPAWSRELMAGYWRSS
jgi:tRNA (adenine37-N6)-methyltransferase